MTTTSGPTRTGSSRRPVLSILLLAIIGASIGFVTLSIVAQGKRIAVLVASDAGSLQLANLSPVSGELQWICDADNPSVRAIDVVRPTNADWQATVSALIPGARLGRVRQTVHTVQASSNKSTNEVLRRVAAMRAQLEIETADGTIEPALGLAASISADGDALEVSYVTIIRVRDATGRALLVDGDPVFNPRAVPLIDRARGLPAHGVRIVLEEADPAVLFPDDASSPEDDAEALRAIENLKRNRPERGVIPGASPREDRTPGTDPNAPASTGSGAEDGR